MSKISSQSSVVTVIGESVVVSGEISGAGNITINGTVEGDVNCRESDVDIGVSGRITANITAHNIYVAGEVKGELRATELVVIKPTGKVIGDIRAPRIGFDDGCQFKGSVDMDSKLGSLERNSKLQISSAKPPSPFSKRTVAAKPKPPQPPA